MPLDLNILGEGVYTPREVARLVGSTPQDILRWTRGSGPNPPLWNAYYQPLDDSTELSFLDLVELRVVRALRSAGLSMQSIRFAIKYAKERYGIERPLSTAGFRTDGADILINALEDDGEYLSLSKKNPGQKVFSKVVNQSLVDLEYEHNQVVRWRPHFASGVVIDPSRYFGDPLLDEFGISTRVIFEELPAIGSPRKIAELYEIPEDAVRNAIRFEERLDKQ